MVLVLEVVGFGSVGDFTGSCFGTGGATGIGGFGTIGAGTGGVGKGGVGIGFSGTGSGFVTSGDAGSGFTDSGCGAGGGGTVSLIPPGEPSAGASVAAKLSPSPATYNVGLRAARRHTVRQHSMAKAESQTHSSCQILP